MSTKQVTITVTQSIRQVDKSGKMKEKSHSTFEVMKPRDCLKEAEADSFLEWDKTSAQEQNKRRFRKETLVRTVMNRNRKLGMISDRSTGL